MTERLGEVYNRCTVLRKQIGLQFRFTYNRRTNNIPDRSKVEIRHGDCLRHVDPLVFVQCVSVSRSMRRLASW